uniref:Serpin domain-containing protein n=1 Tax=Panagrolaimus sp. JU765 TaxID=591449 RepID=A0AC34QCK2_9BILA
METPPTKRLRSAFKPTTQLHYSHVLDVLKQDNCFKNLVFSPICLKLGLAIIYLGAEGETAKQIERFFGENVTKDDIHAFLFDGLASLSKIHKDIDLKLANQLFISKNYQILDSFTEKLKKFEQNFIEKVDDHEFSEKIDDFLQEFFEGGNSGSFTNENDIDDETKLIFLNSIFFKANWFQIFVAAATEDSDFHVTESKTITVKMMKAEDDFYYRQGN